MKTIYDLSPEQRLELGRTSWDVIADCARENITAARINLFQDPWGEPREPLQVVRADTTVASSAPASAWRE